MAHICYMQHMSCKNCKYYRSDSSGDYTEGKICVAKNEQSQNDYLNDYQKYLDHCNEKGIAPNRSNYLDSLITLKGGRT